MDNLTDMLLRGLSPGETEYFYQPIYDVAQGAITKAEVLLRVADSAGGYFDTEKLITQAEKLGCIYDLDKSAFRHACRVQREFREHGITELGVNLSPAACHDPYLIPEAIRLLRETGGDPSGICVEITEIYKLLDEQVFYAAVQALYKLGLKVAIDDFGTGYSSIKRMLSIPFHTIKLDKSLVWGMDQQPLARSLIGEIIQFARNNGITVVAEGIETAEQACILSGLGCHYLQGYFYSRPVPKKQFLDLLDAQPLSGEKRLVGVG